MSRKSQSKKWLEAYLEKLVELSDGNLPYPKQVDKARKYADEVIAPFEEPIVDDAPHID